MFPAHRTIAINSSLQQIIQHQLLIHLNFLPFLRITGPARIKGQILLANLKQGCRKQISMDLSALLQNSNPVDLFSIGVRKQDNITDLPDSNANSGSSDHAFR